MENANINVFINMITRNNESKTLQNIYLVNVNLNLMVENVTQIKSRITLNVEVSATIQEKTKCVKNISGILVHVLVKTANI